MEPFIVSARKYRPETFEDVVGQGAITKTLENAIASNHLAQALLFTGPRGVGKTTCARILAKKINQQDGLTDPDEDFAFNIFELDAASNNSVDDIRNLIDQVRIPPQIGKFKVYIIDEVHMLSQAAFNAFLKTLEEPPAHAIFILATTEKHKIIPTILSRCQIFDFKRISVSDMREHLKRIAGIEGITADDEALHIIAQKADGALRDSLSIFDRVVSFSGKNLTVQAVTENLNVLDRETYFKITDLIIQHNIPQLLVDYDVIMAKGFDGHHFVSGLASHFRDLMVCQDQRTIHLLDVAQQTQERYAQQAQSVDGNFLRKAIELTNDTDLKYRTSRNPRLLVELCLMQLASIMTDGEKKNDLKYIIPAAQFQAAEPKVQALTVKTPVTETSTSQITESPQDPVIETITENKTSDVAETRGNEEVESSNVVEDNSAFAKAISPQPIAQKQILEKPLEPSPVVTESDEHQRLAERRKALLAKSQKQQVSGLSIKAIQTKKEHVVKSQPEAVPKDELPVESFDEETAQKVWSAYAAHLRNRGQMILASIMDADQPKVNGNTFKLRFPNQSMKEDLEKEQGSILEHLKRELNNYEINISIAVDKSVQKKYVFTEKEKYEKLVEKNPAVDLLRRSFDLEL